MEEGQAGGASTHRRMLAQDTMQIPTALGRYTAARQATRAHPPTTLKSAVGVADRSTERPAAGARPHHQAAEATTPPATSAPANHSSRLPQV